MSKKSLEVAKKEAMQLSKLYPPNLYIVMDKKGERAICTGVEWIYRERILEGWHKVATYINGAEVRNAGKRKVL